TFKWQINDRALIYKIAQLRGMSVDQRLSSNDILHYLNIPNFQDNIDHRGLAQHQIHTSFIKGQKAGALGVYVVGSNSHLGEKEAAVIVARGCTGDISLSVPRRNSHGRHG